MHFHGKWLAETSKITKEKRKNLNKIDIKIRKINIFSRIAELLMINHLFFYSIYIYFIMKRNMLELNN